MIPVECISFQVQAQISADSRWMPAKVYTRLLIQAVMLFCDLNSYHVLQLEVTSVHPDGTYGLRFTMAGMRRTLPRNEIQLTESTRLATIDRPVGPLPWLEAPHAGVFETDYRTLYF